MFWRSLCIVIAYLLASCANNTTYYQLYHVESDNVKLSDSNYIFENDDLIIYYDLWSHGGNPKFTIKNKTDKILTINLEKSFFIYNGYSYDYYKARTYTSNTSISAQVSAGAVWEPQPGYEVKRPYKDLVATENSLSAGFQSSMGLEKSERKIIMMPPKTIRMFGEYLVINQVFESCNLKKDPKKANEYTNTLEFVQDSTPIKFSNFITYSTEEFLANEKSISNNFWVRAIQNFPHNAFIGKVEKKGCTRTFYQDVFLLYSPSKFYYKYTYALPN